MFSKKQKILIIALIVFAVLSLIGACILLIPKDDTPKYEEPENEKTHSSIAIYQEAIHDFAIKAETFPSDINDLLAAINEHLLVGELLYNDHQSIKAPLKDAYDNNLTIVPINEYQVAIVSSGSDGTINTADDYTVYVLISGSENTKVVISSSKDMTYCAHTNNSEPLYNGSCTEDAVSRRKCIYCNYLETTITKAPGHNLNNENGCAAIVCTRCGYTSDEQAKHSFTKKLTQAEYLASAGNCITPKTYYYACEFCNAKSKETYPDKVNLERHGNLMTDSSEATNGMKIDRLICGYCFTEQMAVFAYGYDGKYDGFSHSISITTPGSVYYRTSTTDDWSVMNPEFTHPGTYTVYYKVNYNDYTMTGDIEIIINEPPVLSINQLGGTTVSNPRMFDDKTITINGMIIDEDAIEVFTINDETIELNDKLWTYTFEVTTYEIKQLTFYIKDIAGNETFVHEFVAYDYLRNDPNITIEPQPIIEHMHVCDTKVLLEGFAKDTGSIKAVYVNDVAIRLTEYDRWAYTITVEPNTTTEVRIDVYDDANNKTSKIVYICHQDEAPAFNLDPKDVSYNLMVFSIGNVQSFDCTYFKSIKITGLSDSSGILMPGISNKEIQTDDGFFIFLADKYSEKNEVEFYVQINPSITSFTIEVETIHGQKAQYVIDLVWQENNLKQILVTTFDLVRDTFHTEIYGPPNSN